MYEIIARQVHCRHNDASGYYGLNRRNMMKIPLSSNTSSTAENGGEQLSLIGRGL